MGLGRLDGVVVVRAAAANDDVVDVVVDVGPAEDVDVDDVVGLAEGVVIVVVAVDGKLH